MLLSQRHSVPVLILRFRGGGPESLLGEGKGEDLSCCFPNNLSYFSMWLRWLQFTVPPIFCEFIDSAELWVICDRVLKE